MKNLVRKASVFLIKWLGGGDPTSSVETALRLETRGYHADAEEMLIGAFAASPQRSTAVHLARVAFLRQDFSRVVSTLTPFESELGTDAESLYRLGYSLLASRTGDGISQLRKAIELSRGTEKYIIALGAAIDRSGATSAAIAELTRFIDQYGATEETLIQRGRLHSRTGLIEPARQDFEQALRLAPDSEKARKELAELGTTPP